MLKFLSLFVFFSLSFRFVVAQGNHKVNLFIALILRRCFGLVYHMFAIIQSKPNCRWKLPILTPFVNDFGRIGRSLIKKVNIKLFRFFRCSCV